MTKPKKNKQTTLAAARAMVRSLGFSLSVRDREYRLAPLAGSMREREDGAHYTNDIEDAIGTAQHEARRRTVALNADPVGPSLADFSDASILAWAKSISASCARRLVIKGSVH
jgi:hypothetical protein